MSEAPAQIGIVGYGKIARDQHEAAIGATPGLSLAAIADPAARHASLPSHGTLADMLAAHPELDAVSLCQPPRLRFAAAREAILAGRHVLLEKPPGATLAEVEHLIQLARQQNVALFAAWHSREASAVRPAQAMLAGRAIRSVRIIWKEDVRVWHPGQHWIWQPGGFGVFDPGINALSILTALLPEPVRVLSAELETPSNLAAPIAARLVMASASDVPVHAEFDFRQTGSQSWDIEIDADGCDFRLTCGGNRLFVNGTEQTCPPEGEYNALYRNFARLISDRQCEVDLAPLRLVADAFLIGLRIETEPFWE